MCDGRVALEFENGIHYLLGNMYVCVCLAVTDREVEAAIEDGAKTREEVTRVCKAGGDCGACHGQIEDMLEAHGCPGGSQRLVPLRIRAA